MKKQHWWNSKKVVIIISSLIIVIGGGLIFFNLNSSKLKKASNVITKDSKNPKSFKEMQANTDASMVGVKMNVNPVFKDGKSTGNILLENTSNNGNSYIMSISINENEEVYKSDLITKGTRIDEIKLNKNLKKGKYNAVAYFTAYDKDEQVKGTSGINMVLNISN